MLLYDQGHIPGAIKIDWHDRPERPGAPRLPRPDHFEQLLVAQGHRQRHTVVFYGDKNNWWATYAFWVFKLFGHKDAKIMNGGRAKWIAEGRELTDETPSYPADHLQAPRSATTTRIRAFRDEVRDRSTKRARLSGRGAGGCALARTSTAANCCTWPNYPQEGALRGGHIPGAAQHPWAQAAQEDSTFKPAKICGRCTRARASRQDKDVVAYCRIGERSSHTWFVLTYLLGYDKVRNYDGSGRSGATWSTRPSSANEC